MHNLEVPLEGLYSNSLTANCFTSLRAGNHNPKSSRSNHQCVCVCCIRHGKYCTKSQPMKILPLLDQRKCCRAKTDSRNSVRVSPSVERREGPRLKPDVLCCFTLFCSSVLTVEMFHMLLVSHVASPVAQLRSSNTQNAKDNIQSQDTLKQKNTRTTTSDPQFRAFCNTK